MKLRALAGSSYIAFSVGLVLVFLFHTALAQRTIHVPGDASTVQAGIDMSNSGDTVSVAPGTYRGPINFNGKAITVSGGGPGVIFDGGHREGAVVLFDSGETRNSILENVTVQNGVAVNAFGAGGIYITGASPTIRNSTIQNNMGCGIGAFNGAPLISGNTITGNASAMYSGCVLPGLEYRAFLGGGIVIFGLPSNSLYTTITGNTIVNNSVVQGGGGISAIDAGQPLIANNTITQNTTNDEGAGMLIGGNTSPTIIQNLVYDNVITPTLSFPDPSGGAGLTIGPSEGSVHSFRSFITNNTFAGNKVLRVSGTIELGSQILLDSSYDNVQLSNNLIIGMDAQPVVWCFVSSSTPISPPTFDHNDVSNFGLGSAIYSGACTDQTGQNGNISADPNFATDASSPHPYQLQLPSPAIDAGDNNAPGLSQLDFLGQPRIQNAKGLSNGIIDMGVYEYPGVPATVPPPPNFTLAVNPSSITVMQGKSATFSVTVSPTEANLGSILLTCIGVPATASCNFSPSTMNFTNASPQSSTLTVSIATAQSGLSRTSSPKGSLSSMALAGVFLIPTLLASNRVSSNKGVPWMLRIGAITAMSSCVGLSGCGPDRFVIIGAPQTYQLAVQGSAVNSGLTKQTIATLVVTQ
jgi:parallel beta-helix repeat protein